MLRSACRYEPERGLTAPTSSSLPHDSTAGTASESAAFESSVRKGLAMAEPAGSLSQGPHLPDPVQTRTWVTLQTGDIGNTLGGVIDSPGRSQGRAAAPQGARRATGGAAAERPLTHKFCLPVHRSGPEGERRSTPPTGHPRTPPGRRAPPPRPR